MVAIQMSFSDDLRRAITSADKTANAISKECGIDHAALSRFLRGERTITVETADKLAVYFGLRLVPDGDGKPQRKKKPAD